MAVAFGRQARVDLAPPGIGIDRLRIGFSLRLASQSKPSPSTVTLTNLANPTVDRLEEGSTLRLSAGYRGHPLDQLTVSQVRRIEHQFQGRDRLTILTLGSAQQANRAAVLMSAAYQGVVSLPTVVADIAARLGLPVGSLDAIPDLAVQDYVVGGKAEDALTDLLRPRGVEWYEADGELRFRRRGLAPATVGFVLNERTGLIGSPERTEKGVRAAMRLSGLVRLDNRVRVESLRLNGSYKIITVDHQGDTWDGPWATEIEGVSV